MDPIPTSVVPSNPVEDRSAGFSPRQMWQAPLFFLGVAALLAAVLARGFVQPDPVRHLHHDLSEARRLLHRHSGDAPGALEHAQRAVENLTYDQDRAAEAYFLLGSAHIRLAESAGESGADEHWREARKSLEEAERRGLAGDDAGRLQYRLGKAGFHTDDDPRHVVALLKTNKEQADDRAEALILLTQAYLRLNPPNDKAALECNRELREKVPQIGEDVLGPAKLAGAKLLLRLGQQEEARKTLEKINEPTPPAVLAEAHMLLAGLYQEERKWSAALDLWTAVRDEKRVPLSEPGGVLYNLGVCYRQTDQSTKAVEAWTECLRLTHGEEAQAAALALAELRLRETGSDKAVEMLAESVAKVRKAEDWKNSLIDLPHVRELFEKTVQSYREAGRFDLAVRTAELYERVALPPKAQVSRAELSTEWARVRQEQARQSKDSAASSKEEATARELFRQAAEAHAEAVKLLSKKPARDEHIWLSAVCSFDGQDYNRAAEKLTKILEGNLDGVDRLSEGWFLLGESYRNLKNERAAVEAYKKCVECEARFTCRARYQLAMIDVEAGRLDDAVRNLDQNIKLDHHDGDPEARDKSLLALCALLYQGGATLPTNFRSVIVKLEGPLDRIPLSPEAVRARYQLADSYRQLAAQRWVNRYMGGGAMSPNVHEHFVEENQRSLARAAEEFTKLGEVLKNAELASLLTVRQRAEVPFIVAQCRFDLGEYEKALRQYEELAKRFGNRPEGLSAVGGMTRCYGMMGDEANFRQRAEQVRAMLPATEGLTEADRQVWRDWLALIGKTLPPLADKKAPPRKDEGFRKDEG